MVKVRVLGGTPEGSDSLCKYCSRGHVIKGFRATEQQVFCRFFFVEREIPFPVRECTFFEDRRLATKADMEEIAWTLKTMHPTRHIGFTSVTQPSEKEEEAVQATSDHKPPRNDRG
jgi:hypothetical protein